MSQSSHASEGSYLWQMLENMCFQTYGYKFSTGCRLAWAEETKNCTNLEDLRTCLGRLENGLVSEVVSKLFIRNPYIVRGAWCRVKGEVASAIPGKKGEYVYLVDTPGENWQACC